MSLSSVLQTALSGMTAAVTSIDAVSHNLANSRTDGYKSVRPTFAEQTPTQRGSSQIGTGVRQTGIAVDNSPGPLVTEPDGSTVELSNVDIGTEMVNMITAKTQFKANANVFNGSSNMLDVLLSLGRRE